MFLFAHAFPNATFPLCCFLAPEWSDLQPKHPRGPAGETAGAPTDAFCALPQAAPRLRQMQRELLRDGPDTPRGEAWGR